MKTPEKGKKAPETTDVTGRTDKDILEMPASSPARSNAGPRTKTTDKAARNSSSKKAGDKDQTTSRKTKTAAKKRKPSVPTSPVKKVTGAKTTPAGKAGLASGVDTVPSPVEPADPLASLSPIDRLLAVPTLPVLERENRARLQMQSPTKLHFYWSVRENPWAILRKAFGGETGSYTLVLKLVELRSGSEQIHNADADGSWWFDVRPDGEYQAEIGFYAPNRPYIRIVYSNVIETPRLRPSPRKAVEADWTVSANKFAQVLDVAGFGRDAFDVAVAGDDPAASSTAAREALKRFADGDNDRLEVIDDEDIRFAMLAIAEGQKLDELRWKISAELFDYLQASKGTLDSKLAEAALREHFELEDIDLETEQTGPAVFGASLVNFPRTIRSRRKPRLGPGLSPEGSHSYQRMQRP